MRWFRFFDEVLDDPKVRRLPKTLAWYWVLVLCAANRNSPRGILPGANDLAFLLRTTPQKAGAICASLREAGLLDRTPSGDLSPHGWEQRQREYDLSTNRTRTFRERSGNSPDTDTEEKRVDTEQRQTRRSLSAVELAQESQRADRQGVISRLVDRASKRFRWRLTKTGLLAEHRFAGELLDLYPEEAIAVAIDRRQKLSSLRWLAEWMQANQAEVLPSPRPAILDAPPGVSMPEEIREQIAQLAAKKVMP